MTVCLRSMRDRRNVGDVNLTMKLGQPSQTMIRRWRRSMGNLLIGLVVYLAFAQTSCCASSALPTLIAAAPMEVAVVDELARRRQEKLQLNVRGYWQTVTQLANTRTEEDDQWPPPNTLLRKQIAFARTKIKCRDTDVVIVSYPKVCWGNTCGQWPLCLVSARARARVCCLLYTSPSPRDRG